MRDNARITANDLALYMVSSDTMRLSIIKRNKYPNKYAILPYQDAKPWLANFLADPRRDKTKLADGIAAFRKKAVDPAVSPAKKSDAQLCANVLEAFYEAYGALSLGQIDFVRPPGKLEPLVIEGVQVSAPLDLIAHQTIKGVDLAGGIIFRLTQATDSETAKTQRESQGYYAATIAFLQTTAKRPTAREASARISMSIDVQHRQAYQARVGSRRIANLSAACKMIHGYWPMV
jgi:hypothetical protein